MNPPTLSRLHDVKHKDRPQPRDPQAAGGTSVPNADPKTAPADEPFKALVDQAATAIAKGGLPEPATGGTNADPEKPAATKDARDTSEADKSIASPPIPIVFAPLQPPTPPATTPAAHGASQEAGESASETRPVRKGDVTPHTHGHDALKPLAETAEPKTPGAPSAPTSEKFGILLADVKAPAEMPAQPQAAALAATPRLEPLPPAPPAATPQTPPLPVVALPATMAIKALEGSNRFDIRLDPEELGRIDVSLQIDADGGIRASIAAEKPEALQLIVREARALEQAFDQAGFRRDNDALSFSLSDQRQFSQGQQDSQPQRQQTTSTRFFVEGEAELPPALASLVSTGADGRLDVRI